MTGARSRLGRWGEDFVARQLGFERVPFSGGVWPYLQDLFRRTRRGNELAQVKTTEGDDWLTQWKQLETHSAVADAKPRWFNVVKQPNEAYIFETVLVKRVPLGIGGEDD